MALLLTPEILRGAYDFLHTMPPFSKWNLPESEDVIFRVVHSKQNVGWYERENSKHVIAISSVWVRHTFALLASMAHEMIHLHQGSTGMESRAQHNAAFLKLTERVAKIHGFDP